MEWNRGFTSFFYATFIDPNTWGDLERFEITGGSIQKDEDNLMGSASINCVQYQSFSERWVRIWMNASQEGGASHTPLFTGLAMNPSRTFKGFMETNTLNCFSVLKPADDVLLPRGWYANAGSNVQEIVTQLLEPTKAPIVFDGDPAWLTDTIIAEQGATNLSMVHSILENIKWRCVLDGYGRIRICPKAIDENGKINRVVSEFNSTANDVLELSVNVENDWFESPNVFRAISGNVMAIARDDSRDSRFSTFSRGREIWKEETDVVLDSEETIADYASRRLREEQQSTYKVSYKRRFDPDVEIGDIVKIHYPQIDLSGFFKVTSQTIDLNAGAPTSEEAYMVTQYE